MHAVFSICTPNTALVATAYKHGFPLAMKHVVEAPHNIIDSALGADIRSFLQACVKWAHCGEKNTSHHIQVCLTTQPANRFIESKQIPRLESMLQVILQQLNTDGLFWKLQTIQESALPSDFCTFHTVPLDYLAAAQTLSVSSKQTVMYREALKATAHFAAITSIAQAIFNELMKLSTLPRLCQNICNYGRNILMGTPAGKDAGSLEVAISACCTARYTQFMDTYKVALCSEIWHVIQNYNATPSTANQVLPSNVWDVFFAPFNALSSDACNAARSPPAPNDLQLYEVRSLILQHFGMDPHYVAYDDLNKNSEWRKLVFLVLFPPFLWCTLQETVEDFLRQLSAKLPSVPTSSGNSCSSSSGTAGRPCASPRCCAMSPHMRASLNDFFTKKVSVDAFSEANKVPVINGVKLDTRAYIQVPTHVISPSERLLLPKEVYESYRSLYSSNSESLRMLDVAILGSVAQTTVNPSRPLLHDQHRDESPLEAGKAHTKTPTDNLKRRCYFLKAFQQRNLCLNPAKSLTFEEVVRLPKTPKSTGIFNKLLSGDTRQRNKKKTLTLRMKKSIP